MLSAMLSFQHPRDADLRFRVLRIEREDFLEARARVIEEPLVQTALREEQEQRRIVWRDSESLPECVEF